MAQNTGGIKTNASWPVLKSLLIFYMHLYHMIVESWTGVLYLLNLVWFETFIIFPVMLNLHMLIEVLNINYIIKRLQNFSWRSFSFFNIWVMLMLFNITPVGLKGKYGVPRNPSPLGHMQTSALPTVLLSLYLALRLEKFSFH